MTNAFTTFFEYVRSGGKATPTTPSPKGKKGEPTGPAALKRPFANRSLIETLPYAEPDDGVVFLREGERVWYGFEIEPVTSLEMSIGNAAQLSEAIRVMLNQGVPMEEGGRLIIERIKAPEQYLQHFMQHQAGSSDPLMSMIQKMEREDLALARERGQITTTRFFLTFYVRVPKKKKNIPLTEREFHAQKNTVNSRRTGLLQRLRRLGLRPKVMSNVEVKRLIWKYLNGNLAGSLPPAFSEQLDLRGLDARSMEDRSTAVQTARYQVAETELGTENPGYLTQGDRLIGCVSLTKGGNTTHPYLMNRLLENLRGDHFYIMVDFEHLKQGEQRSKIDTAINELDGAINNPVLNAGASSTSKLMRATEAMQEAEYRGKHFWRMGFTVVLYAKTRQELTSLLEQTHSEFSMISGAHAIISNEQLRRTYFNVMPFSDDLTYHRVSGYDLNVADTFPKYGPWTGAKNPLIPLRNRHGGLTGLNLKEGGSNYGVMVIGKSGGGKSVWNMNILLNMVPQGAKAFILDPKHDYDEVAYSLGGQVIPISPDARLPNGERARINIFDPTPGEDMPGPEKVSYIVAVFRSLDLITSRAHQTVIEAALQQFFNIRSKDIPDPGHPEGVRQVYIGGTLSDFVKTLSTLSRIGNDAISPELQIVKAELSALMQPYLAGGGSVLGDFLDGPTTVQVSSECVCFDVEKMYQNDTIKKLGILIVSEYIFQLATKTPGTKVGIFEELGVLADEPALAALVNRWFKTGRSMGLIPIGTSQEVKDFEKLGGVINNASWVIMTGLADEQLNVLQPLMGLSDRVAALAKSLTLDPGVMGEYLVINRTNGDEGAIGDVVQLYMSPEKNWTVTTRKEEKERRAEYTQRYGSRSEAILQLAHEQRTRRRI
ncbi:hypothetical protein Deipr_2499 (plasmid) [Deinococcus proteolyticus MRP]|uniref:TraG P-loop domain-containing protein n=1 Tax=Deinococcus proteolyticus (strain ATCC 35074 / DSM 20540 / JCM 6276 / NBRC 101906 / NCIMB 13154 / VKM Ac-1939 / CCM 2703 / MRP) TaxID=693977 RepID=F0RQQ7_DEIPM|nr:TraC family protein [Deinococcus proteolyticus]ADY27616.1 hypothetical protein Deipr_2499 [Deinococcus proteolyticus MRP]